MAAKKQNGGITAEVIGDSKVSKVKVEKPKKTKTEEGVIVRPVNVWYECHLTLTNRMLGTLPKDKDTYAKLVASRAPTPDLTEEELAELPEETRDNRGWTTFPVKDGKVCIYDYQVRGFFKEAGDTLRLLGSTAFKGFRTKVDKFLFVHPRHIFPVTPDGEEILADSL